MTEEYIYLVKNPEREILSKIDSLLMNLETDKGEMTASKDRKWSAIKRLLLEINMKAWNTKPGALRGRRDWQERRKRKPSKTMKKPTTRTDSGRKRVYKQPILCLYEMLISFLEQPLSALILHLTDLTKLTAWATICVCELIASLNKKKVKYLLLLGSTWL